METRKEMTVIELIEQLKKMPKNAIPRLEAGDIVCSIQKVYLFPNDKSYVYIVGDE